MKSLLRNFTKIAILGLFAGFLSACTEDATLDEVIENIREVPLLETGDDPDEPQQIPGGQ